MATKHNLKQIRAGLDITEDLEDADLSLSYEFGNLEISSIEKRTSDLSPNMKGSLYKPQSPIMKNVLSPPRNRTERNSETNIKSTELAESGLRRAVSEDNPNSKAPEDKTKDDIKQEPKNADSLDKSSESYQSRKSKRRRKYKERTDYFVQDAGQDPLRVKEYDINFKFKQFLEFLFYHIVFFFFLGPLSFIVLYPIAGRPLTKNMGFAGFNSTFLFQTIIWAMLFSSSFLWAYADSGSISYIELYMVGCCVFLRICTIASKYGSMHPVRIQLLRRKYLNFKELNQDYMLVKWINQSDDVIEQELVATVKRHDIDTALFFFNFITSIDEETRRKLTRTRTAVAAMSSSLIAKQFLRAKSLLEKNSKKNGPRDSVRGMMQDSAKHEDSFDTSKIVEPQIQEIKESAKLAKESKLYIKKKANLLSTTLENLEAFDMLSGVNLAREIIFEAKDKGINRISLVALLAGFLRALLPMFERLYNEDPAIGETAAQRYMCIAFIVCNTYFFSMNFAFILVGLSDLMRKFYLMTQLSNLLSVRKLEEYSSRKIYPTMNIFDPLSLRAWINLQKIFMDFGRKYFLRINLNISIFLFFYCLITIILLLQVFEIMILITQDLLTYVFLYELTLMLGVIVRSVVVGASVNDHFRVHKSIIQKNKTVASDLLQLDDVYFLTKSNNFKASNLLYQEGVSKIKFLVRLSGCEKDSHEAGLMIQDYLSKLVAFNDNAIEELDFEEVNNPVKIMGFVANRELVREISVGILSLGFAVLQKKLNL